MSNRRDFLKMLGLGAIAPIAPKIQILTNSAPAVTPTFISGKIKTGGLIANINGSELMRVSSNGDVKLMANGATITNPALSLDNINFVNGK